MDTIQFWSKTRKNHEKKYLICFIRLETPKIQIVFHKTYESKGSWYLYPYVQMNRNLHTSNLQVALSNIWTYIDQDDTITKSYCE